mgnify:FL=1
MRPRSATAFLEGGGEMGAHIRAFAWSKHPLGPPEAWPQALRTVVRLMLNTGHPMYIFWGPELYCFYNDAYSHSIGPERHPKSLGRPGREVWDEIWDIIGPQIDQVMSGGGATWNVNALVPITRHGKREDVYWTYSYGPIDDDQAPNGVGGVLVVCTETTATVLAESRQRRLFEQAPGFIIAMRGPDHVVEFVNDAHRELFNSDDWIGKPIRAAFPSIEGQGFFEKLDEVYRSGETFEANAAEVHYRRSPDAPEETRYLTFIYAPWIGETGKITGIFCEGFDVTETEAAQAALRTSEARFRALVNATSDVVYRMSADWKEMRQLDGRGFLVDTESSRIAWQDEYLFPEDQPSILAVIDEAVRTRSVFQLEHRVRRVDGSVGWTFSRAIPIFDSNGEIIEWFGAASDVTEAHEAREALGASEDRLRLATEAASIGTWDFNPVTGELRWDAGCKRLFGLSPDAEVSYEGAFLAGLHPDDRERTHAAVQARSRPAARAGTTSSTEPSPSKIASSVGSRRPTGRCSRTAKPCVLSAPCSIFPRAK